MKSTDVITKAAEKRVKPKPTRKAVIRNLLILVLEGFVLIYLVIAIAGEEVFTKSPDRQPPTLTPASFGLDYSEVSFPAIEDNLTIRGWFVPAQSEKAILVLHGKGANRAGWVEPGANLAKNGYNVLLIDLRGHGTSDGSNFSFGQYEQRDVVGAVNYLKERGFRPERIGVLSYSMGASTGLLAMARTPDIKAQVADSAYADLNRELQYALPATSGIPDFFLPGMLVMASLRHNIDVNAVRPEEAIKKLNGRHVLLIHGDQDALVPVESIYRLKQAAGDAAETWVVPGAIHVGAYNLQSVEFMRRVQAFFQKELG